MNIAGGFIRRPVMTTLVMGAILIFGVISYRGLPVSDLPNVDFPTLQVSANLPGASPQTMAAAVATPLERQFSTIAGLESMTSANTLGSTQVTLQFALERDLDAAAQDVQAAIATAQRQLPPDMPSPPSFRKVNPADQPILYIALTSGTIPLYELNEYGETMLAQQISTVQGVAQVQVFGSQKRAVRVQLDPRALASRGIAVDDVAAAVRGANVNLPTGVISGKDHSFTIESSGQLLDAESYRPVIVAYRNGHPVRLEELGNVIESVENDKTAAWFVDRRAIVLAVQRQPGTNTVAVATAVKELLPRFREQLPASVELNLLFDRSESIHESVADVKVTLAITLVLVVLVIFVFLRNLSATVIPSLALPMSIVGTFAVMKLLGYSVDNLSLMALTLSVGFVVDDAIVVLENIVRHMEKGKPAREAALVGAQEIGFTIISMTLSLAAVFIPIFFMSGILGRLFHEFAVAISAAILISGFVSLSLTPMLASRFLRPSAEAHHGRVYAATERVFRRMLDVYAAGLRWSLRHRRFTIGYSAIVLFATFWLFGHIPKGFLPNEDTSRMSGVTESQEGTSFEAMAQHQQAVAAVLQADPNVAAFMSSAGARGPAGSANQGFLFARLKPRGERKLSVEEVIEELPPKLARLPGVRVFLQNPPPIRLGGQQTKSAYQVSLQGSDVDELYAKSRELQAALQDVPELQDVTSDLQIRNPQLEVVIDRDRAATLGVTAARIEETLAGAFASGQVSTIYAPDNEYDVIVELLPEYRADPAALSLLYVRSSQGKLVPLGSVADVRRTLGPTSVNHLGQLPAVTLSFNLKPGVSLSQAVGKVEEAARRTLPATIRTSFQGTAQAYQDSLRGLGVLLVLSVLVIYIVLGILYESFIHPLTILSALPFAGFGALVTLLAFRVELGIYGFVGVIMLIGLVKKNGIMMIDFALDAQRASGKPAAEAIYEACLVRFRPIMMTTMAALMGTLPIALGFGAGAESRRPLGLAVVGGLLFSQFLTLFVTPVFFVYMDRLQRRLGRRDAGHAPSGGDGSGNGEVRGLPGTHGDGGARAARPGGAPPAVLLGDRRPPPSAPDR